MKSNDCSAYSRGCWPLFVPYMTRGVIISNHSVCQCVAVQPIFAAVSLVFVGGMLFRLRLAAMSFFSPSMHAKCLTQSCNSIVHVCQCMFASISFFFVGSMLFRLRLATMPARRHHPTTSCPIETSHEASPPRSTSPHTHRWHVYLQVRMLLNFLSQAAGYTINIEIVVCVPVWMETSFECDSWSLADRVSTQLTRTLSVLELGWLCTAQSAVDRKWARQRVPSKLTCIRRMEGSEFETAFASSRAVFHIFSQLFEQWRIPWICPRNNTSRLSLAELLN